MPRRNVITGEQKAATWDRWQAFVLTLFTGLALLPSPTLAQDAAAATAAKEKATAKRESFWVMIEPRFSRPEMGRTIEGGKDTFFVPGREISGYPGIEAYSREEFEKLRISWDAFYDKAALAAARRLVALEPKLIKDEAGAVKYAVIRTERPIAPGLVVATNFVAKFKPILGSDRLVIFAPDRNNLFIFPDEFALYSQYIMPMSARFEDAVFGASREIFLWRAGAKKPLVIGKFGD